MIGVNQRENAMMAYSSFVVPSTTDGIGRITVASDFSRTPGGRYKKTGPYSGELFRERFLKPALASKELNRLIIDLDGVDTYLASFLEEAFGGLIREENFSLPELNKRLEFLASGEIVIFKDLAVKFMRDADRERHKN